MRYEGRRTCLPAGRGVVVVGKRYGGSREEGGNSTTVMRGTSGAVAISSSNL